jgi:hypothetical protein
VNGSSEIWLAVIAVAVAIMAVIQVGMVVAGLRVARRIGRIASELESGVKPLIAHLTTVSSEASRAATMAAAQVERFDVLVSDFSNRIDQTLTTAQRFVTGPAREGMAIVAGVRAAVSALQGLREASRRRSAVRSAAGEEEEESLFIG